MRSHFLRSAVSALTVAAAVMSATAFPAYAENYKTPADEEMDMSFILESEIKPVITASNEVLTLSEAKSEPVRTVTISINANQSGNYFAASGIHYYFDKRLEIIQNENGNPVYQLGDAFTGKVASMCSFDAIPGVNNPEDPDMQNGLNMMTSEAGDLSRDGIMYSFQVKLPSDCKEGDIYPIDIKYVSVYTRDIFSSIGRDSNTAKIMQAYAFTQGIYNKEYNCNFKADPEDIERVPDLASIPANYDGYIAIEGQAPKPFQWGKDNWNFNNWDDYFGKGPFTDKISNSYKKKLAENLTNSEYETIFTGSQWSKAWIEDDWDGSCYGMSSLLLLSRNGLLPYSTYSAGAECLHDLPAPVDNFDVSSLVNYYQMLQVKSVIQQQYRTVPRRSHKENITAILSQLDENDVILIGFKKKYWGGHAITAYDYSYGSWTWNGVTYDGCINTIDPNSSTSYNEKFNIYFNSKTYNWIIPAYSEITSASGAVFDYIGADINAINKGGYLSNTSDTEISSYVARIDAAAISENHSVSKVVNSNGNYLSQSSSAGDIVADTSYIAGGSSEGMSGYNLYDPDAAYKVIQETPTELQLSMDYENCLLRAGSAAGTMAIFDQEGYVQIDGESADYNLSMVFDDEHPTDWFAFNVNGENADSVSMEKAEDGIVLTSDNFQNVKVQANNRNYAAEVTFSTKDHSNVLVYEIDAYTIGISADNDGNGTYETLIAQSDNGVEGDINNDGKFNIADLVSFQQWLLSDGTTLTNWKLADMCNDNVLNVFDLCEMKARLTSK